MIFQELEDDVFTAPENSQRRERGLSYVRYILPLISNGFVFLSLVFLDETYLSHVVRWPDGHKWLGLGELSARYSSPGYTSHASLRAYGAQLGGLASH